MKHLNIVVFVIVAAAILVAAYGVGLLVRQARTPEAAPSSPDVAEPNAPARPEAPVVGPPGTGGSRTLTPEQRAALKQKRAEAIADMNDATEGEKQQFREQIRDQVTPRPKREAGSRRTALRIVTLPPGPGRVRPSQETSADANTPSQADTGDRQPTPDATPEPNTSD
ncbi:MAG: hypothetical protein JW993_11850 [Sedimentisphaerales bacterium]|nr:hypothetical protein [Sedimentisphaerales bacterium]